MTPLGQGGGSGSFENIAAVEMAFVVEVVVDRGMDGSKFLQGLYVLKLAIAASRRLNGWCEFSARLLSQRPQVRAAALPITVIAAR